MFRGTKLLYIARASFTLGSLSHQNYQLLRNLRHQHRKTLVFFLYICLIFMNSLILILEPRRQPEGSYKLGFVLPSILSFVLLSGSFLEIGSLFFCETLCGVRGPYGDVRNKSQLFWKNPLPAKVTKKMSKITQNWYFWTFQENVFISFVWK